MRQIKIRIPEKKDLVRWAKILRFKVIGGFSCTKCGAEDDFNRVRFYSEVHGKRLMISNDTKGICAECTRKELNDKADVVFTEMECECNWCKKPKATSSFPRDKSLESSVHFGGQWWNGHHICQECMNTGFDKRGPNHSDMHKHENGNHYQKNELGLWIKVK